MRGFTFQALCGTLGILTFLGAASPAAAQVYNDGQSHVISGPSTGSVEIGDSTTGLPTTVSLVAGGQIIGGFPFTNVVDSSIFNVLDGFAEQFVEGFNRARISVSGGTLGNWMAAQDTAHISIFGGTVTSFVQALLQTSVSIHGGTIGDFLEVADSSNVSVHGGTITSFAQAYGESSLTVHGGTIGDFLEVAGSSTVTVHRGTLSTFTTCTGGATLIIRGGQIPSLGASDRGLIIVYGRNFNFPLGLLVPESGRLTGILEDGTPLDVDFDRSGTPVPGFILLMPGVPVCCVDYNNDSELDFSDVEGFLSALNMNVPGNCAPGADLNNDGEFDFSDVEAFLSLFDAGC